MPIRKLLVLLVALLPLSQGACVKRRALELVADRLSEGGGTFTQDEDLAFLGQSVPFALKVMETLAQEQPDHVGLRTALCSGFTQYAAVWVEWPAQQLRWSDPAGRRAGLARARRFYDRALRHGRAGLAVALDEPGIAEGGPVPLERAGRDDVPLLFWTGAAWLASISVSREDIERIAQLPEAAALIHRAAELDPDWDRGTIQELLITLEPALPLPGGVERAEAAFERAVRLSEGLRAGPYVALATAVAQPAQDRERFVRLLQQALAIDPDASPADRVANLYAQERARFLLDHLDDLILEAP